MPATIRGVTGPSWGVTAESGVITQSTKRKVQSKTKAIADENGDDVTESYYGHWADFTLTFYTKASTGVAAAAPGIALTSAGSVAMQGNGVTLGILVTQDVELERMNEDFQKGTVNCKQKPLILV